MSPLEIDFRDPSQGLIDLKLYRNVDLTTGYLFEKVLDQSEDHVTSYGKSLET